MYYHKMKFELHKYRLKIMHFITKGSNILTKCPKTKDKKFTIHKHFLGPIFANLLNNFEVFPKFRLFIKKEDYLWNEELLCKLNGVSIKWNTFDVSLGKIVIFYSKHFNWKVLKFCLVYTSRFLFSYLDH